MPVVPVPLKTLNALLSKPLGLEEAQETLPQLGGDVDRVEEDTIHIEYFPDRSDLVSVEGIARAVDAFTGGRPGLRRYDVEAPTTRLEVEDSVVKVRPFILACGIRGLPPLDDERLVALMDLQERLANGIGRRRRRVAIGIHDARDIQPPYRYTTATDETRFRPLQGEGEMSVQEILLEHPKGRAWSHLLPEDGPFPIILDQDDHVLSLPPVINGTRTQLREGTTDLVLDLTGPDLGTLHTVLAILATSLIDQGGRLERYEIVYPDDPGFQEHAGKTFTAPRLDPRPGTLRMSETRRVLGLELDRPQIIKRLQRLGHDAEEHPEDTDKVRVLSPAWRADLLHEWDLIEDVAKGHGYANVPDSESQVPTFGQVHPSEERARLVRTAMVGLGFLEATTLTLTSMEEQYEQFRLPAPDAARPAAVRNPITTQHTVLRTWLTPGLFRLLQKNKHRDHPQSLFEVGQVVDPERDHQNAWHVAAVHADPRGGYTMVKGHTQALLRDLDVQAELEADDHPAFIPGRAARWVKNGRTVGRFGEFHPEVLEGFELSVPVVGFEIDLDKALPLGQ